MSSYDSIRLSANLAKDLPDHEAIQKLVDVIDDLAKKVEHDVANLERQISRLNPGLR